MDRKQLMYFAIVFIALFTITVVASMLSMNSYNSDNRKEASTEVNVSTDISASIPFLKEGFPIYAPPDNNSVFTRVANVDDELDKEIIVSGKYNNSNGLYVLKANAQMLQGWPVEVKGVSNPVVGNLSNSSQSNFEIFINGYGENGLGLNAYSGFGQILEGWPKSGNSSTPAALADIDGDGIDEIFVYFMEGLNTKMSLRCYKSNGVACNGWPVELAFSPYAPPAIADIDADGQLEIVTSSLKNINNIKRIGQVYAFNSDGSNVPGFPATFPSPSLSGSGVVIGDVDGDNLNDIVVVGATEPDISWETCDKSYPVIHIFGSDGILKKSVLISDAQNQNSHKIALADINGDNMAEILLQLKNSLVVVNGDGTFLWGVINDAYATPYADLQSNSGPVVGDIDGDGSPDIVISTGSRDIKVRAYDKFGRSLDDFPIVLNNWANYGNVVSRATVPAIDDIDLDSRNDLIISSSFLLSNSSEMPKVWAFDLQGSGDYGDIMWGQFGKDEKNSNYYSPVLQTSNITLPQTSDVFAPQVVITTPSCGVLMPKAKAKITALAFDEFQGSGVAKVEFYINGSMLSSDTTYPYEHNWSIPAKKQVTYTLMVKAYDAAGNVSTNNKIVQIGGGRF